MSRKDLNPEIEIQYLKLEISRLEDELGFANTIIINSQKSTLLWMEHCEQQQKENSAIKELLRESMEHDLPVLSSQSLASKTYHCIYLN